MNTKDIEMSKPVRAFTMGDIAHDAEDIEKEQSMTLEEFVNQTFDFDIFYNA